MQLQKQKGSLISKGHKMVRLGLQDLDKLKHVKREESEAVLDVQAQGGFDVINWNSVFKDAAGSLGVPFPPADASVA